MRLLHRAGAVELAQRVQIGAGITHVGQIDQALDAGIDTAPFRVELIEVLDPLAALQRGGLVANRQRQQRLEFTDAQVGPEGTGVRRQPDHRGHRALVGQRRFVQGVKQVGAFLVIQIRQVQDRLADAVSHAVVLELQIVHRVDLRHAGDQHATGVDAQVREVGDIDVEAILVHALHRPGVVLGGGAAEVPVAERVVGHVAQELPVDDAAGVDEVDLQVGRAGHLFEVEPRCRGAGQRVERAALQQFGQGALQGNLETRIAEAGETALVLRVQQRHVHHRVRKRCNERCCIRSDTNRWGSDCRRNC